MSDDYSRKTEREDVLIGGSVAVIKHQDQKQCGEEKCLLLLTTQVSHTPSLRNIWAGPRSRGHAGMLLTGLLLRAWSIYFLIEPRTQRQHHPQWSGTSHINHQSRICPSDLPTRQSDGGIFSIEVPQTALAYVRVTMKPTKPEDQFSKRLEPINKSDYEPLNVSTILIKWYGLNG